MLLRMRRNRVARPFAGGLLLERFQGIPAPRDGDHPEEWVCSAVEAENGEGLSYTEQGVLLREAAHCQIDVLVKLLDSRTRLMLQVHPDTACAQKYFSWPYGKTEAWHILDTRGAHACVWLGFRHGITRDAWVRLFHRQDVDGMLQCLHRFEVKAGDTFFIPAGVPHAMGGGVFFAEVQEPTDITLRTERISPQGARLADRQLHGGAGFAAMFDCFDYHGAGAAETLARYRAVPEQDELIGARQTDRFSMRRVRRDGPFTLSAAPYAIAVVLAGRDQGAECYIEGEEAFPGGQELLICTGPNGRVCLE